MKSVTISSTILIVSGRGGVVSPKAERREGTKWLMLAEWKAREGGGRR